MKEVINRTPTGTTTLVRDEHDESGRYYVHQVEHDDHILDRNKRIRLEGLMPEGKKVPLIGDEMRFTFSIPPMQYTRLLKREPDLMRELSGKDHDARIKAARRLSIMHPEWCTLAGNW